MGTTDPCFFWTPAEGGTLETTDIGEAISDIQDTEIVEAVDVRNGAMTAFRTIIGGRRQVRIVLERFGRIGGTDLERDFYALENHLKRGGYVGFANKRSKAWMGAVNSGYATRGDTLLYTGGNLFSAWYAAALSIGDELVVESANPAWKSEATTYAGGSTQITISQALRFDYDSGIPTFVRYRDFYPVLRLAEDQLNRPLVTHDKRITWTLDGLFEYDINGLSAYIQERGSASRLPLTSATLPESAGASSMQSLIRSTLVERSAGGSSTARKLFGGG